MSDQDEQYEKSWILHHILDRMIGSRELVATKRKAKVLVEHFTNIKQIKHTLFYTGSAAEAIFLAGSDIDMMFTDQDVIVLCPFQKSSTPPDSKDKTVFIMRDANSRPGYVKLELVHLSPKAEIDIEQSIVPVGDTRFISSEMYRRNVADIINASLHQSNVNTNGPAACLKSVDSRLPVDTDIAVSFLCHQWPREAYEWVDRPRYHDWPDKALRDQIVQSGCHLVPVGDRTSADPFLQWRISFTTAERKLIYSLTHLQFLIYGLLKYFLKQISDRLKQVFGDENIISSYIIKTVLFYAVENTPSSLWQEKNTFFCFMLCCKILIVCVKAGYCPNYFIHNNNMFHGRLQGENQQKALCVLTELHEMKWECLSVGKVIQPPVGDILQSVRNGAWELVLRPPTESERNCDLETFRTALCPSVTSDIFSMSLSLLSKSKSDLDEFCGYVTTLRSLCCKGIDTFEKHVPDQGNKENYKYLRKSKCLMAPLSSVCKSPGLLTLATYYYMTGNYPRALAMCGEMISSFKLYHGGFSFQTHECCTRYEHLYCGRGYTLLQKCKEGFVSDVKFANNALQFCPSQLHLELSELHLVATLNIPPLPYAVFLTFLCYHELGDTRRRDAALIHLRAVKYDEDQGVSDHWIVHNLLGICYEMVGDTRRALREYKDSLEYRHLTQILNPVRRRIERLQNYQ